MSAERTPPNLAQIFWTACEAPDEERTPAAVVLHALLCIRTFEQGGVRNDSGEAPLSLMELLADLGIEEDLVYASPELVRGETLDERSLVFTIGVLIFERLTDRHPFGTTETGRLARLRRGEMGSGVNYFPSVPKQLRAILMRAMGPFPEERYRGLAAMKVELAAFIDEPVLGEPARKPAGGHEASPGKPKFFEATTAVGRPDPRTMREAKTEEVAAGALNAADTEPDPRPQADAEPRPQRAQQDIDSKPPAFFEAKTEVTAPPTAHDRAAEPEATPHFDVTEPGPAGKAAAGLAGDSISSGEIVTQPVTTEAKRAPATATVVAPQLSAEATRPHRATEQVLPVARKGTPRWLAPALYIGVGALIASLGFVLLGRRSEEAPPDTPTRSRVSVARAKPMTTALKQPAVEDKQPPPSPRATPPATATHAAAPAELKSPNKEPPAPRAKVPPARAVPRKVASRALHGGRQVLKAIDRCQLPQNSRSLRISVYAQKSGRVVRGFVSPRPWLKRSHVQCIKGALPRTDLQFKLPRPDFVEWSFRVHPDGRYEIKLIRPQILIDL